MRMFPCNTRPELQRLVLFVCVFTLAVAMGPLRPAWAQSTTQTLNDQEGAPDWWVGEPLVFGESYHSEQDLSLSEALTLVVEQGVEVRLAGSIAYSAGRIGLIKEGPGHLSLTGNNEHMLRTTVLREGRLHVSGTQALGPDYQPLELHPGTSLSYASNTRLGNWLALQSEPPSRSDAQGGLDTTVEWRVASGEATQLGGIQGHGHLRKTGAGTLRLYGNSDLRDTGLTVAQGRLWLDATFAGPVQVQDNAWLQGGGNVGWLTLDAGAHWAPEGTQAVIHHIDLHPESNVYLRTWADGRHDGIITPGTAQLDGLLHVLAQGEREDWQHSTEYLVVQALGGLDGSQFARVESILPYLEPTLSYTPTTVQLELRPLGAPPKPDVDPDPIEPPDTPPPHEPEQPTDPKHPEAPPPSEPPADPKPSKPERPVAPVKPAPPKKTKPALPEPPAAEPPPQNETKPEPTPKPPTNPLPEPLPRPAPEPDLPARPDPEPEQQTQHPNDPQPEVGPESSAVPVVPRQPEATGLHQPRTLTGMRGIAPLLTADSRFVREAVYHAAQHRQGTWAQVFHASGQWRNRQSYGHTSIDKRRVHGLVLGADVEVAPAWQVGWAVGGSHSQWRPYQAGQAQGRHRINSWHATLYSHIGEDTGPQWGAGAALSRHRVSQQRYISEPGLRYDATSRYTATTQQLFSRLGWIWHDGSSKGRRYDGDSYSKGLWLHPFIEAAWVHTRVPAYHESRGALSIRAHQQNQKLLITQLGVDLRYGLNAGPWPTSLYAGLAWQHAHGRRHAPMTVVFQDDPYALSFSTESIRLPRSSVQLALGVRTAIHKNSEVRLAYRGHHGSGYRDHGAELRLNWRF